MLDKKKLGGETMDEVTRRSLLQATGDSAVGRQTGTSRAAA